MRKRCPMCFDYFEANSNSHRFCSEDCRKFAKKKREEQKKPKKIKSLTQIRIESRELGTTYGKYVEFERVKKRG